VSPSGPTGRAVTAQGHPKAIFERAVERGNLVVAEATTWELGQLTLEEATSSGGLGCLTVGSVLADEPGVVFGDHGRIREVS
jgi:hypothetical protein